MKLFEKAITPEEAKEFLENCECGDLTAIQDLLQSQNAKREKTVENGLVCLHLEALKKTNAIVIAMETDEVEYENDFVDGYRDAMALLSESCEAIINNNL